MAVVVHCESAVPSEEKEKERKMLMKDSDVHVYYMQANDIQTQFAIELWERIRRECKLLSS